MLCREAYCSCVDEPVPRVPFAEEIRNMENGVPKQPQLHSTLSVCDLITKTYKTNFLYEEAWQTAFSLEINLFYKMRKICWCISEIYNCYILNYWFWMEFRVCNSENVDIGERKLTRQ